MTKPELIGLTAALLIGGLLFLKGKALANLVFSPGSVSGMSFDGATPIITFTLIAQNTSSVGITVNSMAGNAYSGAPLQLIGNISNFQPVNIPANSQAFVTLSVRLRILGIVNDIIKAFTYKNFNKEIVLQGYGNVSGIQVPLDLKFSVGL